MRLGHELVRECLEIGRPGQYQLLAAINAVHTDAPTASDTDWSQVVALYDQLTRLDPSPIFDTTVGLDGVPEGYAAMHDRTALKVLVRP